MTPTRYKSAYRRWILSEIWSSTGFYGRHVFPITILSEFFNIIRHLWRKEGNDNTEMCNTRPTLRGYLCEFVFRRRKICWLS